MRPGTRVSVAAGSRSAPRDARAATRDDEHGGRGAEDRPDEAVARGRGGERDDERRRGEARERRGRRARAARAATTAALAPAIAQRSSSDHVASSPQSEQRRRRRAARASSTPRAVHDERDRVRDAAEQRAPSRAGRRARARARTRAARAPTTPIGDDRRGASVGSRDAAYASDAGVRERRQRARASHAHGPCVAPECRHLLQHDVRAARRPPLDDRHAGLLVAQRAATRARAATAGTRAARARRCPAARTARGRPRSRRGRSRARAGRAAPPPSARRGAA